MSIIVAVKKAGSTIVATDSMQSYGSRREHADNLVQHRKVYKFGSSYIGGVGWCAYGSIMLHYFKTLKRAPILRDEVSVFDFFLRIWQSMRKRYQLVNDQPESDDHSPFANLDSEFVVVNRYGLFRIDSDLTVTSFEKYFAIGSGEKYAYGAMHYLYDRKLQAEQVATKAVQAAIHFDQGCGGAVDSYRVR